MFPCIVCSVALNLNTRGRINATKYRSFCVLGILDLVHFNSRGESELISGRSLLLANDIARLY